MLTRRFFIGGLASTFALRANRIFAAAGNQFELGRPELTFGVISDIHIAMKKGGESLSELYSTDTFKSTLMRFRDAGADAVVIAGDMAHYGLGSELVAVGQVWDSVFPNNRAPDGRKVEKFFVTGNHDNYIGRSRRIYSDKNVAREKAFSNDYAKWWDLAFHEEWKSVFEKTINGYSFVGFNWMIGDCNGKIEKFTTEIPDWYAKNGKNIDPKRPFFHIQHPHPRGTVYGPRVWGQDDGVSTKTLMAYSNAVTFSGHSHTSITDERNIWQGGFTSVGCGTLRDVGFSVPGVQLPAAGYENYKAPKKAPRELDGLKAMDLLNRFECRQEQLVRVYSDRMTFSQREAISGESLGPDLVMPLPVAESKPFDFKMREAKAMAPEFSKDAALEIKLSEGRIRKGKRKVPVYEIIIPQADALKNVRAALYDIEITAADGSKLSLAVFNDAYRHSKKTLKGTAKAVCKVACERIPKGDFTVSVRAISCWNRRSAPLVKKYKA